MATDDQQVLVVGQASAPASFTIPGNGQITPRAVYAHFDGTGAAGTFTPALKVISDGGKLVGIYPTCNPVAAGASAEVSWFPGVKCCPPAGVSPGVAIDEFYLDSTTTGISTVVLAAGQTYQISVQGTFSLWNNPLEDGTPEADAMFPGSLAGRVSTQVGLDPDVEFAAHSSSGSWPRHTTQFEMNLGSGFAHVEPVGGPFAVPQPNHLYHYSVVGQGSTVSFRINDTPIADNYGLLQVIIQVPSSAGGSGTLVPPSGAADSILEVVSGVPAWVAPPAIVESDLSLSNVTAADVTTARHGFAPKAPNDATKFLDGTGAYSAPAGTSPLTTKGDLFGHSTVDARIPVGADTFVLTADSAQALGVKWAATSSAGVASFAESGQTALTGAVTISPGAGVTMTQVGQNIAIASSTSGSGSADGWLDDSAETWTYASGSGGGTATFTISGDVHTKYTAGTKVKLTQPTVKYFVVATDATFGGGNTTVTIMAGTSYTLANAAISVNFHSYEANPQGFPGWFTYVPTFGGFSNTPGISACQFSVEGRTVTFDLFMSSSGTSNATTFTVGLPFTSSAISGCLCVGKDNGAFLSVPATLQTTAGSATATAQASPGGAAWTNANAKAIQFVTLVYSI